MTWNLLLSGMPNSGKSTLAYHLVQARIRNALIIDGDRHREMQFLGRKLGFSKEDIMENTQHVVKMAKFAQEQGFNVIISQITPYKDQRDLMRLELDGFFEVFCDCPHEARSIRPNFRDSELKYESGGSDLVVDTDGLSVDICCSKILELIEFSGG